VHLLRLVALFGLLFGFIAASADAQDQKDLKKDDTKKVEPKKEEVKKEEPKKVEPKTEETKKEEPKKEEVKKKDEPKDPKEVKKDEPKDPKEVKKEDPKEVKKEDPKEVKKEDPKKTDGTAVVLAWKFTANTPFYQKMFTSTEQNIKVMGLDVAQTQKQTFYFKWTPIKQDGDKWEIKQEIEGIQMSIDIAGNPVSYDSTTENQTGGANTALAEFFKALKGSSFTLTFNTKTMKVETVTGKDEFLKKLATANQTLEPLLKKILNDQALAQMADPTFGVLPATAKKIDETWESTSPLNLGPLGTYTNKYTYVYKGPEAKNKDLETITVKTNLTYTPPTENDPSLPFKITSAKLETKDAKEGEPGKIVFNTKLGRLESTDFSLSLTGTLTIEVGQNKTEVKLEQKQTTNVVTGDTSFLPKPKEEPKKTP